MKNESTLDRYNRFAQTLHERTHSMTSTQIANICRKIHINSSLPSIMKRNNLLKEVKPGRYKIKRGATGREILDANNAYMVDKTRKDTPSIPVPQVRRIESQADLLILELRKLGFKGEIYREVMKKETIQL